MDYLLISPSYGVDEVRQTEIHTVELPVPDPSVFEVEVAIEKLKVTNHQIFIKSQQVKAGGRTFRYENHKLVISVFIFIPCKKLRYKVKQPTTCTSVFCF